MELAAGSPLERTLGKGEAHAFEIDLEAGHTFDLVVDQWGVDLVVRLWDPQGDLLLEVDNPSGADGSAGPERVFWVGEKTGLHRLTVSGFGAGAGRYEIVLTESRPATEADRLRARAEEWISAGDLLYLGREEGSVRRSIRNYEAALQNFLNLADVSRQADALYRVGRSRENLREWNAARVAYEQAYVLYVEIEQERQQAITLHNLCRSRNALYELDEAWNHCREALDLWQRVGDHTGQARSSHLAGFIFRRLGEGQEALKLYDQAIKLWRMLGNRAEEAKNLHNRGRLYATLGRSEQALVDLSEALGIRRQLNIRSELIVTLNSLATVHIRRGELNEARGLLQESLALQGEGQKRARTKRWAIAVSGLARIHFESGETAQALAEYRRAQEVFHNLGDRAWEAQTLKNLGEIFLAQERPRDALGDFERARHLYSATRNRSGAAVSLRGMARAERQRGNLDAARQHLEEALTMIEDLRTRVASSDLRASYFATKQPEYEFYIDLLMDLHAREPRAGHDRTALAASERARARSLLESLTEGGQDFEHGTDPELLAREKDLARRINAKDFQLSQLTEAKAEEQALVKRLETEQRNLLRQHERVRGEIRLNHPNYAALTQPAPLDVEALQRLLDNETLLLSYKLGTERSFLWAVTPHTLTSHELRPRDDIEGVAERAYRLLSWENPQSAQRVERDLATLSETLLGPVAAQLQETKRLVIVADGALWYIPFGALPSPGATLPLVTSHEMVDLPSASALAFLRRRLRDRPPPPQMLAVLADPVFTSEEQLDSSRLEAEAILALVPPENRFQALGHDANRDVVESGLLGDYRIVHFATHGQLNPKHPALSWLLLSQVDAQGRPRDDGLLHTYEIYGLDLAAELVVLSACETALGEEIRGEGLVGLPRAFLHAGAARVVVSLWKVDDRATAELMEHFYRRLLVENMSPAAALAAAQNTIRQVPRWRAPYYWAGFVLQGEWQDIRRPAQRPLVDD